MAKMKFKDWYCVKHGAYPGHGYEPIGDVHRRLADAMAEWCDLAAEGKIPEAAPPPTHPQ